MLLGCMYKLTFTLQIRQILWSTKGQEKAQSPQTSLVLLRLMGSLLILRLRAYITKQLFGMG